MRVAKIWRLFVLKSLGYCPGGYITPMQLWSSDAGFNLTADLGIHHHPEVGSGVPHLIGGKSTPFVILEVLLKRLVVISII